MAQQDKVRSALSKVLKKNPKATNAELRKAAERVDAGVKKLSGRSFHAKHALPAKRAVGLIRKPRPRKASAKPQQKASRRRRATPVTETGRAAARRLVLDRDRQVVETLAGKSTHAAYDLAAQLDQYVDELARALST